MIQIKELFPGHLKRGLMTGFNRIDKKSTIPKPIIISEAMKNGSNAGKTERRKISKPDNAASYACFGYAKMNINKIKATKPGMAARLKAVFWRSIKKTSCKTIF